MLAPVKFGMDRLVFPDASFRIDPAIFLVALFVQRLANILVAVLLSELLIPGLGFLLNDPRPFILKKVSVNGLDFMIAPILDYFLSGGILLVIAWVVLARTGGLPASGTLCPECLSRVSPAAIRCPCCRSEFRPATAVEALS